MGDPGSIPGSGRSPGERNGNPLQYFCLENSMDGGAWWVTVHGVIKSRTRLSDFTFTIAVKTKCLEDFWIYFPTQPVNLKGNQSWIFTGRTDAETEAPILWPLDVKSWFIRKDPDTGKYWRQEEKGMTEDEMVGWHHQLDGHEFEQALGDGDGQGSMVCCSPLGHKESDTTEWLNNVNNTFPLRDATLNFD